MVEVAPWGNWDPLIREKVHNSLWSDYVLSTKVESSELGTRFIDNELLLVVRVVQLYYRTCLGAGIDVGFGGVLTEWAQSNGLGLVTWDNAVHDRTIEMHVAPRGKNELIIWCCTPKGALPPIYWYLHPSSLSLKCRSQSKTELLIEFRILFYIVLSDFGFVFLLKYAIM